jgi:adenylate kinase
MRLFSSTRHQAGPRPPAAVSRNSYDNEDSFMKLILLGAPGAGKGTVAKMLTQKTGAVQISTGDILRGAVQAGTPLGKEAEAYMKRGDLVPDALIMGIMEKRLQEPDCAKGFLLDGFPRTIPQAEELKRLLARIGIKFDMAVNIDVPRDVILDRLTTRRTCANTSCQAIYNVKSNPPKKAGICDKCGSPVVQREDETEEAISHRLETYNKKTAPLIGFYEKEGMLLNVNATSSEAVIAAIEKKLGK